MCFHLFSFGSLSWACANLATPSYLTSRGYIHVPASSSRSPMRKRWKTQPSRSNSSRIIIIKNASTLCWSRKARWKNEKGKKVITLKLSARSRQGVRDGSQRASSHHDDDAQATRLKFSRISLLGCLMFHYRLKSEHNSIYICQFSFAQPFVLVRTAVAVR